MKKTYKNPSSCILTLVLIIFGKQLISENSFANNENPVAVLKVPENIYTVTPNDSLTFDASASFDTDS